MKNLRVLIITNDENSSSVAAKIVSEKIIPLKIGANFYYVKNFDEIFKNYNQFFVDNNYDFICILTNTLSIKIYDVVDDILYRHESSSFSFLSTSERPVKIMKKQDELQIVFLLNESGCLSTDVKEKIRTTFEVAKFPSGYFNG